MDLIKYKIFKTSKEFELFQQKNSIEIVSTYPGTIDGTIFVTYKSRVTIKQYKDKMYKIHQK